MFLNRLFRPKAARDTGELLFAKAVERARRQELYKDLAAPDTLEGRFEIYTAYVVLLLDRLGGKGMQARETAQALFEAYVSSLDNALREIGVGDLSVGKKMRTLGEAFYGRVKSYEQAFAALPDRGPLEALLVRTVYAEADAGAAPQLADLLLAERGALAAIPIEDVLEARITWAPA